MAKNWTVAEVATSINENGTMNANTLDFGRRFPVATNLIVGALAGDKNAVLQLLAALPEYVTMTKVEKVFKTAIEEGTTVGPVVNEDDVDAEETEVSGNENESEDTAVDTTVEDDLESMSGKELYEMARAMGIPGKEIKTKEARIAAIRKARAQANGESDETLNPPVEDEADEKEDAVDYSKMTAKELYKLCKERGIEVEQKKPAKYYIEKLEEADAEEDNEEETVVDYSKMTAKELYGLCKERGIKAEQKKPAKYYIELLEAEEEEETEEDEWAEAEEPAEEKPAKKPAKSEEEEWDI